ncbi:neutral zinc metallopeptidase [Kribbella sp. VKM Ac-2566]|uniref:neutral zinc metallopeptidase n=1 Tax=Kribbella sp. VKM Ac-2566 TaxID=2512218 RepID=UPI0010629642|nr:neutral zinc metallopeptidase [Kribbella sp. VKM Ac-2566]TDW98677.1 hypothetical protein EV647_3404 [Kribbella sp. VKM Ac-2566]
MRRTARVVAVFVAVVLAGGCTREVAAPEVTPTATPTATTAPVQAPVGKAVQAPEPIKDEFLLYNPLYRAGQIAAVSCSLPTAKLANKQAMIRYANAFVACLDRAWAPVITRAGFDFVRPSAVYSSPAGTKTDCAVMDKEYYGLYCSSNHGIYFNWPEYIVEGASQEDTRASVQWLIAHEYGHHVQEVTGILDQYHERYSSARDAAQEQVEEHRSEMQAHCFAAAFFGANRETFRIHGERLDHYGHPGYDRRAADSINFDRWLRQAFKAKGPSGCKTWAAPAGSVTGV